MDVHALRVEWIVDERPVGTALAVPWPVQLKIHAHRVHYVHIVVGRCEEDNGDLMVHIRFAKLSVRFPYKLAIVVELEESYFDLFFVDLLTEQINFLMSAH